MNAFCSAWTARIENLPLSDHCLFYLPSASSCIPPEGSVANLTDVEIVPEYEIEMGHGLKTSITETAGRWQEMAHESIH